MKQRELNRAVARSTGESVATVKRLGFLLADEPTEVDARLEPELEAVLDQPVIDWEAFQITQRVAVAAGRHRGVPVGF